MSTSNAQSGCGNSLSNGGSLAPEGVIGCNAPCRGNASEFCGGTNRLDVYTFNNTFTIPTGTNSTTSPPTSIPTSPPSAGDYKYYSCRTEGSFSRALTGNGTTSASMTVEYCSGFCTGYIYFGMEYGQECELTWLFRIVLSLMHARLLWKQLHSRIGGSTRDAMQLSMLGQCQSIVRSWEPLIGLFKKRYNRTNRDYHYLSTSDQYSHWLGV